MCMFCRSLFVFLYFFIWPLCFLFFFDLRILITSLWYLQTLLILEITCIMWLYFYFASQCILYQLNMYKSGVDPGFQVRGGALKKNCAERRETRKYLGYFVWKITILRQKNHIFSNFRGGGGGAPGGAPPPPPGSAPVNQPHVLCGHISLLPWEIT